MPHPPPQTPDGRYILVRGRLWRASNPALSADQRQELVQALSAGRRAVKAALASGDDLALAQARQQVNAAKIGLGERGPPWWTDGAKDWNRYLVKNTSYAPWWAELNAD